MQVAVSKISKGNRLVEFNFAQGFKKDGEHCTHFSLVISDILKNIGRNEQ